MSIGLARRKVNNAWSHAYSPEPLAPSVVSLHDQPLGYRINIFLARLCFRGIYFPMMGKLAWLKVISENRRTIFQLVREAIFGRKSRPEGPDGEEVYEPMTSAAASGESS